MRVIVSLWDLNHPWIFEVKDYSHLIYDNSPLLKITEQKVTTYLPIERAKSIIVV